MQVFHLSDPAAGPNGYDALRDRAFAYLQERNARVSEDELIQFIFGAATRPELWQTLLGTLLGTDHRFLQVGPLWCLATEDKLAVESAMSFVAFDVETTGLRPNQHRIIEIGLARYRNGRCLERYSSLVNPERRIPEYIRKLTGLTDSDLVSAPRFAQIAGEVVAFIGADALLGHNIGFDISFLNAELERAKMPRLQNPSVDTVPMAMRVLGRSVRPSLDRVATAVGLNTRTYHRALGDAELTAAVALRLLGMANEAGIPIESLLRQNAVSMRTPPAAGSLTSGLLDRSHLERLPRRPGVYLMIDANERVLYVGKAKSIRDRVASYYSQPLGYTRKMDGLVEAIARIDFEETGSELVALLLESQLIRRHQPPYNKALRNSESYPYIRIEPANPWPHLRLAKHRRPDGARYFGPYRSASTARDAIDLLNRRFGLRSCSRGFKTPSSYGNPCLELDLKRCSGPCVGRAVPDEYRAGVRHVMALLDLERADVIEQLGAEIAAASEAMEYERAQRLRRDLETLTRLRDEQRALASMALERPYVIVQPGVDRETAQLLLVIEGRWWALVTVNESSSDTAIRRLEEAWTRYLERGIDPIDHAGVDEANIIARWRKLDDSGKWVIEVEQPDRPSWDVLVAEALERYALKAPANQAVDPDAGTIVAYDNGLSGVNG
jgi:DNA polymerase-3 subunit epsilon